jgi:Ca2+-binding RTX toxin-like protein
LWRNSTSGQIGIWNSNGAGGFTYQIIPEGDPTWNTFNGNDTLVASAANSTLFGNPGNTTFSIGPGAGKDTIYNFQNSQDTLQFNHALFANFAAAMTSASQVDANTVFAIDANDSVTLENVNKSSLAASNFHFS